MNRVLSNIAFLVVLNLLVKPFWIFGIELTVQNRVGPEAYGEYFALFNFVILFQILLDLGINSFNNRAISQDSKLLNNYFSSILVGKLLLGVLYFIFAFSVAFLIGYSQHQIRLLLILLLGQMALSFLMYFRSNLGALQLFKQDGVISISDKLLMIGMLAVVLWTSWTNFEINIYRFVLAQTIAYIFAALLAGFLVLRQIPSISFRPKWDLLPAILKSSLPFALLFLLMAIYNRVDGVMIERLLPNGKEEAGIYAAAYRILDAVNQIGLLSASILYPVFSRMIGEQKSVNAIVVKSAAVILSAAFIITTLGFYFRFDLMNSMYVEATPYYGTLFGALIWSFLGIACTYVFGTLLTAGGHLKQLNIIALFGMLLNVTANYFLINKYGALGAAWATLFTQSLIALIFLFLSVRYYKISVLNYD